MLTKKNLRDMTKNVFNPFPNDRILDTTKLKAFADDKMNAPKMIIYLFNLVENTVGKGENAGYRTFFSFSHCVFKRLIQQTRKNQGLFGKGLRMIGEYRPRFNPYPNY